MNYTFENPMQSVEQIERRDLDAFTNEFWRECNYLVPHIIGLDNYKKRSSVLILYAGNNGTTGELMIGATPNDQEHNDIHRFVEVLLKVIPKYDYKTVIFDRATEALHRQVIENLDYIQQVIDPVRLLK